MFREGDIVGIRGKLHERALNLLLEPYCSCWHFLLIGQPLPANNDYVIYEMSGDGCHPGRLSFYSGQRIRVYRCPDPRAAVRAVQEASRYGRDKYDYILFPRLFLRAVGYWIKKGFQPVPYREFINQSNRQLICTELVAKCYENAGYPIVTRDTVPTPAAIEQAALIGRLESVFRGFCRCGK